MEVYESPILNFLADGSVNEYRKYGQNRLRSLPASAPATNHANDAEKRQQEERPRKRAKRTGGGSAAVTETHGGGVRQQAAGVEEGRQEDGGGAMARATEQQGTEAAAGEVITLGELLDGVFK